MYSDKEVLGQINEINIIKEKALYRQRRAFYTQEASKEIDGRSCIDFSSNDYLGLSQHKAVQKALIKAVNHYGFGSGSSPVVSGYSKATATFEKEFADFIGYPCAMFFNSGYQANLALMSFLAKKDKTIIADKYIHASVIDGVRLSGGKLMRYPHQDLLSLQRISARSNADYCVTEGIFSMDGDIAPLSTIYKAIQDKQHLVVDDAHGFGVLGSGGKGSVNGGGLSFKEVPICVVPLGKAMGGMGAMICASKEVIEILVNTARAYIYSTAAPPFISEALRTSLELLHSEERLRHKLFENIQYFNDVAKHHDLPLYNDQMTPVRSILIKDNALTVTLQQKLLSKGMLVSCIRPPTVPKDTARLRVSLSATHQLSHIDELIKLLVTSLQKREALC